MASYAGDEVDFEAEDGKPVIFPEHDCEMISVSPHASEAS
jgi:hypothetical protein